MSNIICKGDFWDLNSTWYSQIPDFTQCFQNIVFVFLPCLCFSLFGIYELFKQYPKESKVQLPWSLLILTKLILCIYLIVICTLELCLFIYKKSFYPHFPDILLYAPLCKVITYTIVFSLLMKHKACGIKSSSFLLLFWLFQSLFGLIMHRSSLLKVWYEETPQISMDQFIIDMIYYPPIYCQFFLSLFAVEHVLLNEKRSPLEEETFISFFTFCWFDKLIFQSTKRLLTLKDFPPLIPQLKAKYVWNKFQTKWIQNMLSNYSLDTDVEINQPMKISLAWALMKAFWPVIILYIIIEIVNDFVMYIPPLLLDLLINFITDDAYAWRGYLYCGMLFIAVLFGRIMHGIYFLISEVCALQIKSALMCAVYRKALKISNMTKRNYTCGEMVNLVAVDIDKIFNFILYATMVFGSPLRIALTIIFLWSYLGPSSLAGVAVITVLVPLSVCIAKINHSVQAKQMSTKDCRLKHLNEILNGIKVLKLSAWELPFIKKITSIRKKEVYLIRKFLFCFAASSFIWACAPFLIAATSFVTFVLVDEKNKLNANIIFVSINTINLIKFSLFSIPDVIANLIQTNISLKRLRVFLLSEEHDPNAVGSNPDIGEVISIKNAVLSWSSYEDPILNDINLHVPKGSLIAIIGSVGSGKSSVLSALLGEMYKISGSIDLKGTLAYVPQQAWILNQTLQQNILFIKSMDKVKYNRILEACCLKPDIKQLFGGDQTEIGEKGVNLSGGQKQRISIARSVYQDADIYLFDDPLSAVDAHVGKALFENVIGNKGLLKNKTRILITHNISVLPYVDEIISMKNGQIVQFGKYDELIDQDGPFSEFIASHTEKENIKDGENSNLGSLESISKYETNSIEDSLSIQTPLHMRAISMHSIHDKDLSKLVEDEKMEIGNIKLKMYINYLKHAGFYLLLPAIFCYMSYQAFEIGANIWLSEWTTDDVLDNGAQDISLRNFRIIILAVLGLCQGIIAVIGNCLLAAAVARASKKYHGQMLLSVMQSPMAFFDTTPMGRIMNRFGKDIDVIDCDIPMNLDGWLACFAATLGTFIVIGMSTPLFLAFTIPIGLIYYFMQKLYLIASRQIKRLESTSRSPIFSHFQESIQGVSSIRAYNVMNEFISEVQNRIDRNILCSFYWFICNRWLTFRLDIITSLIIFIASILAIENRHILDPAIVGLSLTYALSITSTIIWLVRTGTDLENRSVSIERIDEYSHLKPEALWNIPDKEPNLSWPMKGNVIFQNYSTRYREGLDIILKNLNLHISSNEKVGIIGRTGAGKTSITLALFRIIEPVEGSIIIDDIDITSIGLHSLRSKLTIIPQDPVLFTGTLRLNLDPNDEYPDEAIWASLERAHLKDFVKSLSKGLNYEIAEGGENLSVGQRQLVCLARALLKKSKILVLDEATAAVDLDTDHVIQQTIRTEFDNHTIITIAHRLNTIMDYNKIIVMDNGTVIESGNPRNLLKNPESRFYVMAKDAGLI